MTCSLITHLPFKTGGASAGLCFQILSLEMWLLQLRPPSIDSPSYLWPASGGLFVLLLFPSDDDGGFRCFSSVLIHTFLQNQKSTLLNHFVILQRQCLICSLVIWYLDLFDFCRGLRQNDCVRIESCKHNNSITTASSADSRIHSMKLYGCQMTAWVIF